MNLQWGWDQLEGRAGAYLPELDEPLAVRGATPDETADAVALLTRLGYRDVAAAEGAPGGETLSTLSAAELKARLAGPDPPIVIDVRTPEEWERGVIDGARLVEQDAAPGLVPTLDPAREYAVICAGGYRSSQLASLMRRAGFERVHNVIDGMWAWYGLRR